MALDPVNSAVDRVRLLVGDIRDIQFLDDATYTYLLDKHSQAEYPAAREAAMYILAMLAPSSARQRAGRLEVYGSDFFDNYLKFLDRFIKDPIGVGALTLGSGYAGGISVSDMCTNDSNPDVNYTPKTPYEQDKLDNTSFEW